MRRVPRVHALKNPGSSEAPEPTRFPVLHARVVANAGGGPDKTILRSPGYAPDRYLMIAAYLHPAGASEVRTLRDQAQQHGCAFHGIPERGALDPIALWRLLRLCRRQHIRIFHAHDYKTNLLGLALRKLHPMTVVTTMHGFTGESARVRLYDKLDRITIPRCDAVAAVSGKLYQQAQSFGVPAHKLALIPNGVEVQRYARASPPEQAKAALGLSAERPALVVLGRLSPEKGQDRAIDTLQGLRGAGVDAQLVLVGDGPTRSELEAQARRADLTDRVTFAGWSPDPRPYLHASDLLLLPSRTEGLPNAVLEAMASGLAVAAATVGAVPEALDYGRAGCLLDEDTHTWAPKLAGLLSSPGRLSRLAQAGHERAKRFYGFDLRMRRMIALYDRALGLAVDETPLSFETDRPSTVTGEVKPLRQAA